MATVGNASCIYARSRGCTRAIYVALPNTFLTPCQHWFALLAGALPERQYNCGCRLRKVSVYGFLHGFAASHMLLNTDQLLDASWVDVRRIKVASITYVDPTVLKISSNSVAAP
jgi:hypothetical protein